MPREVLLYTRLYVLLFCATITLNARYVSSVSDRCPELVQFDACEIENHLSTLNLTDVPTVKMMAAGFKCPISALPFGALKSDWSRLLLLQEAQPDGSVIGRKLVRLMRILIIAYFQMEERFDVTSSDAQIPKKCLRETMNVSTASDKLCNNFSSTIETLNNDVDYQDLHMHSSPITPLAGRNDCSKIKSNATRAEIAAAGNSSSFNNTIIIPFDARHEKRAYYNSSWTDFNAASYPGGMFTAKNGSSKVLDNCLKHTLKDIVQKRSNRTHKVFEFVKNKVKHTQRAARDDNGIDYGKNHRKILPPTNDFQRYITLHPFNVLMIPRTYRMQESNGIRASGWEPRAEARELEQRHSRKFQISRRE